MLHTTIHSINNTNLNTIVYNVAISFRYGMTDIFISDKGTEFVNNTAQELNARAGCTH